MFCKIVFEVCFPNPKHNSILFDMSFNLKLFSILIWLKKKPPPWSTHKKPKIETNLGHPVWKRKRNEIDKDLIAPTTNPNCDLNGANVVICGSISDCSDAYGSRSDHNPHRNWALITTAIATVTVVKLEQSLPPPLPLSPRENNF